jgi:hypothetical protein
MCASVVSLGRAKHAAMAPAASTTIAIATSSLIELTRTAASGRTRTRL